MGLNPATKIFAHKSLNQITSPQLKEKRLENFLSCLRKHCDDEKATKFVLELLH